MDVLHEVELLVACSDPEVLAVVGQIFFLLLSFIIGEGHAALLPEGRIGKHVVVPDIGVGYEGIGIGDHGLSVYFPDVVQKEVHECQPAGPCHYLIAPEGLCFQEAALVAVKVVMVREEIID